MTKSDFRKLFLRALDASADNAERKFRVSIPRLFSIELHAPGSPGKRQTVDEALDKIYLGENRFYKVIDVAVKEISPEGPVVFVRVSGHSPIPFEQTWDPSGLGPFKQIEPATLEGGRTKLG